jgi:antitoxin CptB
MSNSEVTESIEDRKRRLTWQCRRGIKEVEVLLGPFFEKYFDILSPADRDGFEAFLKEQDADIFEWFTMRVKPADPQTAAMVDVILSRMAPGL